MTHHVDHNTKMTDSLERELFNMAVQFPNQGDRSLLASAIAKVNTTIDRVMRGAAHLRRSARKAGVEYSAG